MTTENALAIRPRPVRHNGACGRCKARVSIALQSGSVAWLHALTGATLGAPMVSLSAIDGPIGHVALDDQGCWIPVVNGRPIRECCGRTVSLRPVRGRLVPEHKCGARCRMSKGFVCDCSCGGANHGCG